MDKNPIILVIERAAMLANYTMSTLQTLSKKQNLTMGRSELIREILLEEFSVYINED